MFARPITHLPLLLTLFAAWLAGVSVASVGCSGGGPPPPDSQLKVEDMSYWYNKYKAKNNRQPPPNEDAFVKLIQKVMKEEQNKDMPSDLLISPRDNQKIVVQYGKPHSNDPNKNVVAHEKEGYDGKKWMVNEMGQSREVDDAELQQALSAK
jgi:hypothetical protein